MYSNIRGLLVKKDRNKVSQISDISNINNGIGAVITESWLNSEILDAEVQINGFNIFRSDRIGRIRGGVAVYMRKELHCKQILSFSNGVVEA